MDHPIVPGVYTAELVQLMNEEGVGAREVLRGTGLTLSSLSSPGSLITHEQQVRAYANAEMHASEPGLGFRLGARVRVSRHGVFGHAMLCSPDVRQALRILTRYKAVRGFLLDFHLREQGDVASLSATDTRPLGKVHEVVLEEALAMFAQEFLPELGRSIVRPLEVRADYPRPPHHRMYERLFGCPVIFDAAVAEVRFSAASLDEPLELSNTEMARICEERCEVILDRLGVAGGFVHRVRGELLARPAEFPDLDEVAAAIHVSPRTLRRKLKEEGSSFREVLNDVRKSLALDYLENSRLAVEEVASMLGYEDAANFNRAFRKWVGQTPGRYRAACKATGW